MNQRSTFSRSRELKTDKPNRRTSEDDNAIVQDDEETRRSPYKFRDNYYNNFDKNRPRTEGHNSLVFRRHERGKFASNFAKNSTPETSPGRQHENRYSSGSFPQYKNSYSNFREKEFPSRRSEHIVSCRVYDDSRLLTYLSRILRDEDKERQATLIRQLKDIFSHQENYQVILSNLKEIIATFDDLLQTGYSYDFKQEFIVSLGTLGAVLGIKAKSILEWLFKTYKTAKSDDVRAILLKSLSQMLKADKEKMNMVDLIPYMMTNVQSALEVADIPTLLVPSVDVILEIASSYPEIFSSHFTDTVDILIGWHIDTSQPGSVTKFTSQALINFKQFWLYDINFTLTLLGQFLEDMGSYAEKLPKYDTGEETELTPAENVMKIHSLVRVLTTVLKSLGNVLTPDDNGPFTWTFLTNMLKDFITCVLHTVDYYYSYDLLTSANDCFCLLLKQLQCNSEDVLDLLEAYIDVLLFQCANFMCERFIVTSLRVMTDFVRAVDSHLPTLFVEKMFDPVCILKQLRCSQSVKVQQHMLALVHAVLDVKNVSAVEELYKFVIGDIEEAVDVLERVDPDVASQERAQVALLFSLSCLVEIGNAKHSIIRMWALKPSFFELMTEKLKPTSKNLALRSPAVQYGIVFTLYSHCQRHRHFVSSSSMIHRSSSYELHHTSSSNGSPILMNVLSPAQQKENLNGILVLLANLLSCPETSLDCRLLAVQWTHEIVKSVGQNIKVLISKESFKKLVNVVARTAYSRDCVDIEKNCGNILLDVLRGSRSLVSPSVWQCCFELCVLKMSSDVSEIQEVFGSILVLLPLHVMFSSYLTPGSSLARDVLTACRKLMSKASHGSLTNQHFKAVTSLVFDGTLPDNEDWLQRIFYSCPPSYEPGKLDRTVLTDVIVSSPYSLWFWAVWEVAQTCVTCKLRTPLGKPQETFMAIERALKSYVKSNTNKQVPATSAAKKNQLLRVHLLLMLMESLEKLLYNAFEGSAFALPSAPKTVRAFFRTNKNTCLEWLARVRATVAMVALNAGQPALSLRNSFELLAEYKNLGKTEVPEFNDVLYLIVKALVQLRCPEAIIGVHRWCKDKIGQKFLWMKGAIDQAAGRFESAVQGYTNALQTSRSIGLATTGSKDVQFFAEPSKNGTTSNVCFDDLVKILGQMKDPDHQFHAFVMQQMTECYTSLGSYSDVSEWTRKELETSKNGLEDVFFEDVSYLKALTMFENSELIENQRDDTLFKMEDFKNSVMSTWNVNRQLHDVKRTLLKSALQFNTESAEDIEEIQFDIGEAKSNVLQLLKVSTLDSQPYVSPSQSSMLATLTALDRLLKSEKVHGLLLDTKVKFDVSDHCCSTFIGLLSWQNVQLHLQSVKDGKKQPKDALVDLLLITASLARKQQNLKLSQRLLLKSLHCLSGEENSGILELATTDQHLDVTSFKAVLGTSFDLKPSRHVARLQREGAKLLHSAGDVASACDFLLQNCLATNRPDVASNTNVLRQSNARSLLNAVKYMQQDNKNFSEILQETSSCNSTLDTVRAIENVTMPDVSDELSAHLECETVVGEADFVVGRMLALSVRQCPSLTKAWLAYASWCYRWGRKVIESAGTSRARLQPEEESAIRLLLPRASSDQFTAVTKIVTSQHRSSSGDWDNQEGELAAHQAEEQHDAEDTKLQLMECCPYLVDDPQHELVLQGLVDVWRAVSDRTYAYYKMAARAYLKFLLLNGDSDHREDDNVTATLRLLRLVVKHASELRDVLEDGLMKTPTAPWRGIIPQLFSRLNHPELYVRQSISDLLCRVAEASPHLIVFPAVIGSLTLKAGRQMPEETSNLFKAYFTKNLEESSAPDLEKPNSSQLSDHEMLSDSVQDLLLDEEESEEDSQKTAIMQNCFAALVETLGRRDGRTIAEVKNLVHELHRITLLWDELWLGTLNLHHSEANRRIAHLEKEITKVSENSHLTENEKKELILEKYNVYIMPTIFVLEQLQIITSQTAETPHEQWFQKTFEKHIDSALNKLKNPLDPSLPQQSWTVFKKLHQIFQQKLRHVRSPMQMDDISPVLANLKTSVIPMPGIKKKGSAIVTVQSVNTVLTILPTKTKPKKIAFIGSDGNRYGYLFKGLEDLHLDERIMQFLSIVNNMFAKNKKNGKVIFNARHYSVTPLGPRSGLIQWVDGATPLFSLYKKWQQREAMASTIKGQNSLTGNVLRPSDIYYNKLTPLLKEKGINNVENRKEWPLSVLTAVLKELMNETPCDLLSKELWCHCSSASQWWNVTQTYNHSTAVMSVIGYVIGLGDRHLDNVLVDLATGEVVHIDYNVCFEKGKNLRVPEKVPFRMTPNIETALGITGVEGTFRVSCEHVLKVLRKGRETLLTLLEAFVYDPLVDWTPGIEGGYTGAMYGGRQVWAKDLQTTRQTMEADIACSMFCIRVAEMKGEWTKNRDELLETLAAMKNVLDEWEDSQGRLQTSESEFQEACLQKVLLEEAQASTSHQLYSLPKRIEEITVVKNAVSLAQETVQEKLKEYNKWHTLHCDALATVSGPELTNWRVSASNNPIDDSFSASCVVEFLQTAGQGQLVQQCEHVENELSSALQQQQVNLRTCIELLATYATIVQQFGPNFQEQGRCYKWKNFLENFLGDFSISKCQDIISDTRDNPSVVSVQTAVALNFELQGVIADANAKLHTLYERQLMEGVQEKTTLASFLEDSRRAVIHLVSGDNFQHTDSHLSLLCMFVTVFCGISKRLMMMEKSASAAGDSLVDLTSWGGHWFLDEMCSVCANVAEYTRLLLDCWTPLELEMKNDFNGVQLACCIFQALEDLSVNFQNIILPEAIQCAQDPTVLEMISKLDRIIARSGVPLDRLVLQLESNARNIIMGTQVTETWVNDVVKKLRNEFESLMRKTEPHIPDLTHGQMLLMGFNGLFTKIDSDFDVLLMCLDSHDVPAPYKKLDVFRDTVAFAPFVHNLNTRAIMRDVYFVRKLVVIQQFFHCCREYVASLLLLKSRLEPGEHLLATEQQLVKPIKRYTADYVRNMVLGLPSQALGIAICSLIGQLGFNLNAEINLRDVGVESRHSTEDIAQKAIEICINERYLSKLPVANDLTGNFDAAWRQIDTKRRLEQNLLTCKSSLQRLQLQLTRFQWLHEDMLVLSNVDSLQMPTRTSVMSEMRKLVQSLVGFETSLVLAHERYVALTSGIEQRLKWATGANPQLVTVQEEFEAAIAARTRAVSNSNQFARELVTTCNSILHFEALRTRTTESLTSDNSFLALITRCQDACILAESCNSQISPIEERLVSLNALPENGGITKDWIASAMDKVSQWLTSCREALDREKTVVNNVLKSFNGQGSRARLHELLTTHRKLMSEVKKILMNLAKSEEQEVSTCAEHSNVLQYIAQHKQFSENVLLSKLLNCKDLTVEQLGEIKAQLPAMIASVNRAYNELLELAAVFASRSLEKQNRQRRNSIKKGDPNPGAVSKSRPTSQKKAVTRDPRTGKAIQERNTYATNVWKRVKMKLDGRDPDATRKATVSEQVDFIIKEAVSHENLAVLYEGWTPWV